MRKKLSTFAWVDVVSFCKTLSFSFEYNNVYINFTKLVYVLVTHNIRTVNEMKFRQRGYWDILCKIFSQITDVFFQ